MEQTEPLTKIPEEDTVFESSQASIVLPSDTPISVQARALAILIMMAATLGFINGLDFATPESGLVRPHEFIYRFSEQAPPASAVLDGVISNPDGSSTELYLVELVYMNGTVYQNTTDEDGNFHFENINPGLAELWIHTKNFEKGVQHRILLTPPVPGIEPIGFSKIDVLMPTAAEYEESCEGENSTCVPWVDMASKEMEMPLMDPQAGSLYFMMGFMFMGLSVLAATFAIIGFRNGSRGLLRTGAVVVFFTQGHYYTSCLLGLLAIALSFAVPSRE